MIGWWYVVVCACVAGASSLVGYMLGERSGRKDMRAFIWGLDHTGEPMTHPPGGACYCKIPGDGYIRCGELASQHKGDSDG